MGFGRLPKDISLKLSQTNTATGLSNELLYTAGRLFEGKLHSEPDLHISTLSDTQRVYDIVEVDVYTIRERRKNFKETYK